jgi:hypothetical protein
MDDTQILQQIEKLVDEERELRDQAKGELQTNDARAWNRSRSLWTSAGTCFGNDALCESWAKTPKVLTPATPLP